MTYPAHGRAALAAVSRLLITGMRASPPTKPLHGVCKVLFQLDIEFAAGRRGEAGVHSTHEPVAA